MAEAERKLNNGESRIDFQTDPSRYRHWKLEVEGDVATLLMDVDEKGALFEGYELKLNSYDLGVDIELADAIERLRFEHPQVKVILLRSGKPRVFCAGANIRMLAGATHAHKVNFCKFTNETRNGIEDASENSGLATICVINGTAAGGGYELALAADHIMLIDDGSSAVSLPELPLLAVLPGTGGLTRVTDKRKVRRDHADVFCTTEEGIKGKRAVDWRLVDEVVPGSKLERDGGRARAGIRREVAPAGRRQGHRARAAQARALRGRRRVRLAVGRVRARRAARHHHAARAGGAAAGVRRRHGRAGRGVLAAQARARARRCHPRHPRQRIRHRRDRVQVGGRSGAGARLRRFPRRQQRSLARARDQGPCGSACSSASISPRARWSRWSSRAPALPARWPSSCSPTDRSYMLIGQLRRRQQAAGDARRSPRSISAPIRCRTGCRGSRAASWPTPPIVDKAKAEIGKLLDAEAAEALGLVTFALDDIDWEDEIRVFLEERASFSPDGLTGLEANLRFGGPETMESKIFARLTAWQNWIFQRPNAVGEEGALKRYGTGQKPVFDTRRV